MTETDEKATPQTEEKETPKEPVPHKITEERTEPGSILVLAVEIPEEVVTKRVESVLEDLRKDANIPGFRKGKAPTNIVRRHLGKAARGESVARVIPDALEQIAEERSIDQIGEPRIEALKSDEDSPLTFEIHFEVRPKIDVPDLKSIEVEVEEREVADEMVEDQLANVQRANAILTPKEGKVAKGDAVVVDVDVADAKGAAVPHLSQQGQTVRTADDGPGFLPPEVVKAITGKAAGETVEVGVERDVQNQEEGEEEVAPAKETWTWKVTVKEVKSVKLPDLDDEFAKDVGDFDSLDALRTRIRKDMEDGAERQRKEETVNAVIDQLLEQMEFDAPKSLVAQAQMQTFQRDSQYLKAMGMTFADLGQETESYFESTQREAERRVRAELLVHAIGHVAKVEVTDADVDAEIERMAEQAGRKPLAIRAQLEARKELDNLRHQLEHRKLHDHIAEVVKVKMVKEKAEKKPAKKTAAKKPADKKPAAKRAAAKKKAD